MRKYLFSIVVALGFALPVHAQIPVTDGAAIAKAVEQLTAWKKQYDQMLAQINVAKDQLRSVTGQRNLGAIIDNIATTQTVPAEIISEWRKLVEHEKLIRGVLTQTDKSLQATVQRANQIRALMAAINQTSDPKAIAEVQGRIQAETAMVMNDFNRVQLMQVERANNQQRIEEQFRATDKTNRDKPLATW